MNKIIVRIEPVQFCCFHKAVDYGTGLRSGHGIDHHPVLPADGEPPDSSFSPVVVDRHFTIREEYPEIRLLVDTIPDPITRSVDPVL